MIYQVEIRIELETGAAYLVELEGDISEIEIILSSSALVTLLRA
jgi:hypothetical protein